MNLEEKENKLLAVIECLEKKSAELSKSIEKMIATLEDVKGRLENKKEEKSEEKSEELPNQLLDEKVNS